MIQQIKYAYEMQISYHLDIICFDAMCITLKKMKMWQNTEEPIPKHVPKIVPFSWSIYPLRWCFVPEKWLKSQIDSEGY